MGLVVAASVLLAPSGEAGVPASVAPVRQRTSEMVTSDPLPTAQIDGVVYAQVVVGSTVFAGGSFSHARPAGAALGEQEVVRSNLLSYDLKTGELRPFAPELNGTVKTLALSADKDTLYVGGQFTGVGSKVRNRFAAFDVSSGKLTKLAPSFNASVAALAVSGGTVYAGGGFSTVNGSSRSRLAAVNVSKRTLTGWAPKAEATVQAMTMTPDRSGVVVGGSFASLNGTVAKGMGLLSASSGKTKTWKINSVVKDYGPSSAILSLTSDKDTVYGSGFGYGGGNYEGAFAASPKDGAVRWLQDCHGDTYSVAPLGGTVYSTGHAHFCGNIGGFPETNPETNYRSLAVTKAASGTVATNTDLGSHYGNFAGRPAPAIYNWFPELKVGTYTGQGQAAWSVATTKGWVVLGGEFLAVNGVKQQGLVRFAVPQDAPKEQGPVLVGPQAAPTATVSGPGTATITWPANNDRDDLVLTHELLRDGVVVDTRTTQLPVWQKEVVSYTDTGLVPGTTYTYSVRTHDGDGNTVTSPDTKLLVPVPEPSPTATPVVPTPMPSATPVR